MSPADQPRPASDGPDGVIRDDLDHIVRTCADELTPLSGASLLLTGATGSIGRYLVESIFLSNEVGGGPPCVLTLPTRQPELLRSRYAAQVAAREVVVVAWGDRHAIGPPDRGWDYVVHGAAATDPARIEADPIGAFQDTVDMAASVAGAAAASAARRVVLVSSGAVYGDRPAGTFEIPETFEEGPDPSGASHGYGEAKRLSEQLFRQTGLDVRIARIFSVTGPYQDLTARFAVPELIRQADETGVLRLSGDGTARRSFCYATDLSVVLLKLLLGSPRHGSYNVGCRAGLASIGEVAATIAEIFGGLDVRIESQDGPGVDYVPRLDRLDELYEPQVGLREGLLRACHSMYARGAIARRPAVGLGTD